MLIRKCEYLRPSQRILLYIFYVFTHAYWSNFISAVNLRKTIFQRSISAKIGYEFHWGQIGTYVGALWVVNGIFFIFTWFVHKKIIFFCVSVLNWTARLEKYYELMPNKIASMDVEFYPFSNNTRLVSQFVLFPYFLSTEWLEMIYNFIKYAI